MTLGLLIINIIFGLECQSKRINNALTESIWARSLFVVQTHLQGFVCLLPKYQPKRGGDLGWGKLFRFNCGIKNYFQLAKTNLRTQFNCNIDMIENQTQAYISNWISKR